MPHEPNTLRFWVKMWCRVLLAVYLLSSGSPRCLPTDYDVAEERLAYTLMVWELLLVTSCCDHPRDPLFELFAINNNFILLLLCDFFFSLEGAVQSDVIFVRAER